MLKNLDIWETHKELIPFLPIELRTDFDGAWVHDDPDFTKHLKHYGLLNPTGNDLYWTCMLTNKKIKLQSCEEEEQHYHYEGGKEEHIYEFRSKMFSAPFIGTKYYLTVGFVVRVKDGEITESYFYT